MELEKLSVRYWVESLAVDTVLLVLGKMIVYLGLVVGIYVFTLMSSTMMRFAGFGLLEALLASGYVMLFHAAFGFACIGIGQGLQSLRSLRSSAPADSGD